MLLKLLKNIRNKVYELAFSAAPWSMMSPSFSAGFMEESNGLNFGHLLGNSICHSCGVALEKAVFPASCTNLQLFGSIPFTHIKIIMHCFTVLHPYNIHIIISTKHRLYPHVIPCTNTLYDLRGTVLSRQSYLTLLPQARMLGGWTSGWG